MPSMFFAQLRLRLYYFSCFVVPRLPSWNKLNQHIQWQAPLAQDFPAEWQGLCWMVAVDFVFRALCQTRCGCLFLEFLWRVEVLDMSSIPVLSSHDYHAWFPRWSSTSGKFSKLLDALINSHLLVRSLVEKSFWVFVCKKVLLQCNQLCRFTCCVVTSFGWDVTFFGNVVWF